MEVDEEDLSGVKITYGTNNELSGVSATLTGRVLSISHPAFTSGTKYTVTVESGTVKGSNGEVNAGFSWYFTTTGSSSSGGGGGGGGGGGDYAAPYVVSTDPVKDAVGAEIDKPISVTFSESVQSSTSFAGIVVKDKDGKTVDSATSISSDNKKYLSITPKVKLANSAIYTVTIPASSVKDSANNNLKETYTFSFTTKAEPTVKVLFTDLEGHWALASVTRLVEMGVVSGYPR